MTNIAKPHALVYSLVKFLWGDPAAPNTLYLTDLRSEIVVNSQTYLPQPLMEIQLAERTGSLQESDTTIRLSLFDSIAGPFVNRLTSGEPHSKVTVGIRQVYDDGAGQDVVVLFVGEVENYDRDGDSNKPGTAVLKCVGPKGDLEIPLGVMVSDQCQWTLGHSNTCWRPPATPTNFTSLKQTCTLTGATGKNVLTSGLTNAAFGDPGYVAVNPNTYWRFGYLTKDGVSLKIRDVVAAGSFELTDEPPNDWIGASVVATPGCSKYLLRCREWNREYRFFGLGLKMPSYQTIAKVG